MSSKSDEKLTPNSNASEGVRPGPAILRLVPREQQRQQEPPATEGIARQDLQSQQSMRRHRDHKDDDPGPTAT